MILFFFFFNDTATTEIYTLSLHDALPISGSNLLGIINDLLDFSKIEAGKLVLENVEMDLRRTIEDIVELLAERAQDRKSTRLNSSHSQISYAVFCLKKKKKQHKLVTSLTT